MPFTLLYAAITAPTPARTAASNAGSSISCIVCSSTSALTDWPLVLLVVHGEVFDCRDDAWLWIPSISAATIRLASSGSSPSVSKLRPPCGTRTMLTIGARMTFWCRERAVAADDRPYARASSGENVEASETGAGSAVAGSEVRTPAGPSVSRSGGMPSRGDAGEVAGLAVALGIGGAVEHRDLLVERHLHDQSIDLVGLPSVGLRRPGEEGDDPASRNASDKPAWVERPADHRGGA